MINLWVSYSFYSFPILSFLFFPILLWLKYLVHGNWPFCIRVPNKHQNRLLQVTRIFSLSTGETMAIWQPRKVWGQMVYLAASKKGSDPMVVICNAKPCRAISDYLQRWQIETMFQAMKGWVFNLEDTHLMRKKERKGKKKGKKKGHPLFFS